MFFWLSKILWGLAAPSNLIALALAVAAIGLFTRYARAARVLCFGAVAAYVLLGVLPVGLWLFQPLENRFPMPAPPASVDGIVVLGGGMDDVISEDRGLAQLVEAGTRMTQAAALARRFPDAKVIFSGGSGRMSDVKVTEADAARRFFDDEGIAPARLLFEDRSRNTWENAVFTQAIAQPKPGENWLLVTSAFHMPRSMGIFRKVGFDVIGWPADYNTPRERVRLAPNYEAGFGLHLADRAVREYIGLVAYYLSGKTTALFPAP